MVFLPSFNLSLNFVVWCWWSEPQSAPGLVFADYIELLHLQLQRISSVWFQYWLSSRITGLLWQRGLHNSVKLWAMPCRATQDRWVMVESSDKIWSTGEGNGKYSCFEKPMNSMKRQKDRILKDELPRSVGAQYANGDQWRNNSRKNEGMEPKQKQHPSCGCDWWWK